MNKIDTWMAAFIKHVLPRLFSPTRPLATSFDIILKKNQCDFNEENKNEWSWNVLEEVKIEFGVVVRISVIISFCPNLHMALLNPLESLCECKMDESIADE